MYFIFQRQMEDDERPRVLINAALPCGVDGTVATETISALFSPSQDAVSIGVHLSPPAVSIFLLE